ncbi:MAG: hypothetical protein GY765_04430 [bacterium]|nr:hypothetical protein [bacterium]
MSKNYTELETANKKIEGLEEELETANEIIENTMYFLNVHKPDDIEEALESNENLEARITELEDTYPPDCVFDTFRWLCQVIGQVVSEPNPTGLLAKKVAEQPISIIPEQMTADGFRWMIDNDPGGTK